MQPGAAIDAERTASTPSNGRTASAPPASPEELLARAHALAGLTLGELARRLGVGAAGELMCAMGGVGCPF